MRWIVKGADKATGVNQLLYIDADTRDDAEAEARLRGVLVSNVSPDRAGSGLIKESASTLELLALLVQIVGVVAIIGGCVAAAFAAGLLSEAESVNSKGLASPTSTASAVVLIGYSVTGIVSGVLCFGLAAVMRMLAGIGLAVREIASRT